MYHDNHSFSEACILITSRNSNNRRFGSGFVVYHSEQKSYIVTCAHVVDDVGRDSIDANGYLGNIVGIGESDGLDLAIIETNEVLETPVIALAVHGSKHTPISTAGFRIFGKHFAITPLTGKITEVVALKSISCSERIKAWNLEIHESGKLQDGYSGSPVIDLETGYCLGVISYKEGNGESGLAISIEELIKIWSKIPILIDKSLGNQTYCERLSSRAYSLFVTGNLSQSLEIYQHIKRIEPYYPNIEIRIRNIEQEMGESYVNRYGVICDQDIFAEKYVHCFSPSRSSKSFALLSILWIPILLFLLVFILFTLLS